MIYNDPTQLQVERLVLADTRHGRIAALLHLTHQEAELRIKQAMADMGTALKKLGPDRILEEIALRINKSKERYHRAQIALDDGGDPMIYLKLQRDEDTKQMELLMKGYPLVAQPANEKAANNMADILSSIRSLNKADDTDDDIDWEVVEAAARIDVDVD